MDILLDMSFRTSPACSSWIFMPLMNFMSSLRSTWSIKGTVELAVADSLVNNLPKYVASVLCPIPFHVNEIKYV